MNPHGRAGVIQRILRDTDYPVLAEFKRLIFLGKWIEALQYLRQQYGIGTGKEYEFEIGNLNEGKGHDYAETKLHPKKEVVIVLVDTSKVLELIMGSGEAGFEALVSTLRHEYAHVKQFHLVLEKGQMVDELKDNDLSEFLAYSEELLQSYTSGKGVLKAAPALSGDELYLAYQRAVKHYKNLGDKHQKAQQKRYNELLEAYQILLEVQFQYYCDKLIKAAEGASLPPELRDKAAKMVNDSFGKMNKKGQVENSRMAEAALKAYEGLINPVPKAVPKHSPDSLKSVPVIISNKAALSPVIVSSSSGSGNINNAAVKQVSQPQPPKKVDVSPSIKSSSSSASASSVKPSQSANSKIVSMSPPSSQPVAKSQPVVMSSPQSVPSSKPQVKSSPRPPRWVPDSESPSCCVCKAGLWAWQKHHCRSCGKVVCGDCSTNSRIVQNPAINPKNGNEGEYLRVCDACFQG